MGFWHTPDDAELCIESKKRSHQQAIDWAGAANEVIQAVVDERKRQVKKWELQNHSWGKWCHILSEEVGELNKCFLEADSPLRLSAKESAYSEAIQVAAVALAIAQQIRTGKPV